MKFGNYHLLFEDNSFNDKKNAYANLGDNIIVLAIDYIYERLGISKENIVYINKDGTRNYDGEYIVLIAAVNLWDSSLDLRIPMSSRIYPIFISLVANRDVFMERRDLVQYFKKYEPIGCRDEQTLGIFRKHGIEAYLMGCHTICFPRRKGSPQNGKIFLVDTANELEEYIPDDLKEKCEHLTHAVPYQEYPVTLEEDARLNDIARNLLKRYANEAKLVVTSRLHAAAPCIAMGIPVIFASNNIDFRFGWLDKHIKLYSLEEYSSIDWNPRPIELETTKEQIIQYIGNSITRIVNQRKELFTLSEFYESRNKTQFLKLFRNRVEKLKNRYSYDSKFNYIIWGAGQHCCYAYNLVSEIFPEAQLTAIVDKYRVGKMLGVEIIKDNELDNLIFEHVFITTVPGKIEAINKMKNIYGQDAPNYYTVIASQQKS